jgi:hypothetical protein
MLRAWLIAALIPASIAHAEPPKVERHRAQIGGLTVKLPVNDETRPLRSKQRQIFKSTPESDAPPALLARDSKKRWLVGVPGAQRLTDLMWRQRGLSLTLFGVRF